MGTFTNLVRNYRLSGLTAFFKIKFGFTQNIKIDSLRHTVRLRPNSSDVTTFKHIFAHGDYDFDVDQEPQIIIDAGANIGLASVYFANKYPLASIVAIELAPSNFDILLKNTSKYKKIKAINAGLWHKNEMLKFKEEGSSPWGFKVENSIQENSIDVRSITMNEVLKKINFQTVDILKIDIEGAEVELFSENYENWLPKIRIVVIETHDRFRVDSTKVVKDALSKFDFIDLGQVGENLIFKNQHI